VRRVAYRLFRSTSTFQYRLGRQLTPAGKFALAALVAAAVIGFDTNRTVGYQVFTLLAALLSVSTAWSGGFRVRLDVRRVLPRFVTAGEPAAYPVVIRNGTARPQRGLVLLEDLADPRPAVDEFLHAREPGEERRNWFDRTVGYPRWAWLVARKRGAAIAPRPLPALRPGDAGEVVIELLPLRRGRLALPPSRSRGPIRSASSTGSFGSRSPARSWCCRSATRCRTWHCRGRGSTSVAASLSSRPSEIRRNSRPCATTAPATRCAASTGGAWRGSAGRW